MKANHYLIKILDMINQIHLYSIKKQFNKKGMILSLKKAIKQINLNHKNYPQNQFKNHNINKNF